MSLGTGPLAGIVAEITALLGPASGRVVEDLLRAQIEFRGACRRAQKDLVRD